MIENEIREKNLEIKTVLERLEHLITLPPPVKPVPVTFASTSYNPSLLTMASTVCTPTKPARD